MSIKIQETTKYSITDCRTLSRAEMLGFIAFDIVNEDRISENFLNALVKGPWSITCSPKLKAITYKFEGDKVFMVVFWPKLTEGMQIDYFYPTGSWSTQWSVEDVMDMLLGE